MISGKNRHQSFRFLCSCFLISNHRIGLWLLWDINCLGSSGLPCSEHTQPLSCQARTSGHKGLASAFSSGQSKGQLWQLYGLLLRLLMQLPDWWPATLHYWGHVPNFTKGAHVFWLLFMGRSVLAMNHRVSMLKNNLKVHFVPASTVITPWTLFWWENGGLFDNEVLIIIKFNIVKYFNTKKWL